MTPQEKIFQSLGRIEERLKSGDKEFKNIKSQVDEIHQTVCHDLVHRVTTIETTQSKHLNKHEVWFQRGWKLLVVLLSGIGGYFGWTLKR